MVIFAVLTLTVFDFLTTGQKQSKHSQNSTKCPEYTKPFARTNSAAI